MRHYTSVNQFTYAPEGTGRVYPLPLYSVGWHDSDDESKRLEMVSMEISGITGGVVSYFCCAPAARVIPMPTNYFDMLGVPPKPWLWGQEYGYNPLNTDRFQAFARDYLVEKANWLNNVWKLGFPGIISTNQIGFFQAMPFTNSFMVSGNISNHLYFQIGEGRLQLFEDYQRKSDAFTSSRQEMESLLQADNHLNKTSALTLARQSLAAIGLDEIKLGLPKPVVTQVREPFPEETEEHPLPIFDIIWKREGDPLPLVAMQVSGISETVTLFANNCPEPTMFSLPTTYIEAIGLPTSP